MELFCNKIHMEKRVLNIHVELYIRNVKAFGG